MGFWDQAPPAPPPAPFLTHPLPPCLLASLQFESWSYPQAIFISWGIALPEYSLQVPANRIASARFGGPFSAAQLKVIAEACSLTTFAIFSTIVLKETPRWVDLGAFGLIMAGVLLSLLTKPPAAPAPPQPLPVPPPPPVPPAETDPKTGPAAAPGPAPIVEVVALSGRKFLEARPASGDGQSHGGSSNIDLRLPTSP